MINNFLTTAQMIGFSVNIMSNYHTLSPGYSHPVPWVDNYSPERSYLCDMLKQVIMRFLIDIMPNYWWVGTGVLTGRSKNHYVLHVLLVFDRLLHSYSS